MKNYNFKASDVGSWIQIFYCKKSKSFWFIPFCLLLSFATAHAYEWEADGVKYQCDDEYSKKVYTNFNFSESKINFSGRTICGSSFMQEVPDSSIFPEGTEKLTLVYCHVQNVVLPPDTVVMNPDCDGTPCWTKSFEVQNDLEDWVINEQKQPVEPVQKELFLRKGVSIDPADIPDMKLEKPITAGKDDVVVEIGELAIP